MQVKVFEAEDMRSALEKVKKALGPDALILSSRSIYKNKFGIRGKPWIEVTAAVNDGRVSAGGYAGKSRKKEFSGFGQPAGRQQQPPFYNRRGHINKFPENRAPSPDESSSKKERALLQELEQMKEMFQSMIQEFSGVKSEWKQQLVAPAANFESQDLDLDYSDQILTELYERGVGTEVLQLIAERINDYPDSSFGDDPEGFLEQFIADTIRIENPLSESGSGQKRLAFIGPTGVGKTTTVAKIAGKYILDSRKRVALATIDNHRIAAAEQLKIYGHIMNVPVEVARTPEHLREIFGRHLDKDLILVDTGGRSPKDENSRQELTAFLDPVLKIDNHLVLSAAAGQSELFRLIYRFKHLNVSGLVMTKLDECDFLGSILNAQVYSGRPLSFLTNGQKVPQDLLLPEPRELARKILKPNEVGINGIPDRVGTFRRAARIAS